MGVHDVDAMQWVARSRITRVYAQKIQELGHGNEDALYAVVNFENGAIGCIDYSWAWPDGLMNGFRSSLEIVGVRSAAYLDCSDQGYYEVRDDRTVGGDMHLWPEINGRIVGDLADELIHFVDAVSITSLSSSITVRRLTLFPSLTRSPGRLERGPSFRSR